MRLRFRKVCFTSVHGDICVHVYTAKLNIPCSLENSVCVMNLFNKKLEKAFRAIVSNPDAF